MQQQCGILRPLGRLAMLGSHVMAPVLTTRASCRTLLAREQQKCSSVCAACVCRDVETAQSVGSWPAALDQLRGSKRKMLPAVNAAGELVSTPSAPVNLGVEVLSPGKNPVGFGDYGFITAAKKV